MSAASLQKSGGCGGCADAGASSEQRISAGQGGVQITATDANSLRLFGLSTGGTHQPSSIQYALRLQGGVAEVRESGAYRTDVRFAAGDTLGVWIVGGAVQYSKNGTVFYTSTAAVQYPLMVDVALLDSGSTISDAKIVRAAAGATAAAATAGAPRATTSAPAPATRRRIPLIPRGTPARGARSGS